MKKEILRFAFFGNEYQAKKSQAVYKIIAFLQQRKAEILMDKPFYEFITQGQHMDISVTRVFEGDDFEADFAISMGGDGTLLETAARIGAKRIPIIGVNMGRLGFLASILPSEVDEALDEIYSGNIAIEEHAVIQVEADGEPIEGNPFALNDIAVLKRDNASMISIRASINGEYLVTYQADGLIVSTPTGSTAYSLSNGGPIIVPQAGILCLTPVAPHSLNIRPIAINDDNVIQLSVGSRSHNFLVAIDGRSEKLREGTTLTIRKAPHSIRIVKRHNQRYFSTLREKMMWGADQREGQH